MSDCERFAQIAQDKWGTVSESIRSLMLKEWQWANCSGRSWQMSDSPRLLMINKRMSDSLKKFDWNFIFWYVFFKPSDSHAHSLFFHEWCEQIAQFTHQKWTTMSALLRSLTKNERPWGNSSGRSPKLSKWENPSLLIWLFAQNAQIKWANRSGRSC